MTKDEPDINKNMANRLRTAINSLGRGGKVYIAEVIGVSNQAINGWITTGRISKENLATVARITGYNLNWIITGKGDSHESNEATVDKVRHRLDGILAACDLAMRHSNRVFTDEEKLDIYLEGIEFAGRKNFSEDLVKHYLEEIIKKSSM